MPLYILTRSITIAGIAGEGPIIVLLRNLQLDHIRGRVHHYSGDNLSIEVPTTLMPVGLAW